MKSRLKDILHDVSDHSAAYRDRLGCRTREVARRVGPRRGGIALSILAAAIGLPILIRYLKARREEMEIEVEEYDVETGTTIPRRRRVVRRPYAPTPHT
jgi:hypothetical protein